MSLAADRPAGRTLLVAGEPTPETGLIVAVLAESGFVPTWANGFAEAKAMLASAVPDLLLTNIRLLEYNGLHLVLRGKATHPDMAALAFSSGDDPVLREEADALGATFIVRPIAVGELLAAVFRTLYCSNRAEPIHPPFERRCKERRNSIDTGIVNRRTGERRRHATALLIDTWPPASADPPSTANETSARGAPERV